MEKHTNVDIVINKTNSHMNIEFVIIVSHKNVILRNMLNQSKNIESNTNAEILIKEFHENVILRSILNQFIKMKSHKSMY